MYFHLIALAALVAALIGALGLLSSLVGLILPDCIPAGATDYVPGRSCLPPAAAARNAGEGALLLLMSVPLFLWHVTKARETSAAV